MTCEELKGRILDGTVGDGLLVLVCPDGSFIANQYADRIASSKGLTIKYVGSLDEISPGMNEFFEVDADALYVMHADEFSFSGDVGKYRNAIVICGSVKNADGYGEYVVEMAKPTKDNVQEYMQVLCPGVSKGDLEWLYDSAGGDLRTVYMESSKISAFPKQSQQVVFDAIKDDGGYSHLSSLGIFNCVNAFMRRDRDTLADILRGLDCIDVEGTGLVTLLMRSVRNCIDVSMNTNATAKSLGMSDRQYQAVKYNCRSFSGRQLVLMYEFLTGIDYRLKSGRLELDNRQMVGYVLVKLMEISNGR